MKCGLLGRKLGHSYSPQIHRHFGDYAYVLYEKEPQELEAFLRYGDFDGLNVTMPYKKSVIPYLDELTPIAAQLGAVNTIVRRNGKCIGINTDYSGFRDMLRKSGLSPAGKKCLILGSGGASQVVKHVLQEENANVIVISRTGENNYENLSRHADAAILVNTTPLGMYPNNLITPVDLNLFPCLEGVLDLIYNPAQTKLLMDAEKRQVVTMNGLYMLVSQAKAAAQWFTDTTIPQEEVYRIHMILKKQMENIILVGMPGCGKSTIGKLLSEKTEKTFIDCDLEIEKIAKKSIPRIFAEDGERVFRDWETQVLTEFGKQSGFVIATGGGCVTERRNYPLLHQNGRIIWLQRDIAKLPTCGRPLSQKQALTYMYENRVPQYTHFADHIIDNNGTIENTINAVLEAIL